MLGATEANAHCTKLACASRIFRRIGIRAHLHLCILVGPIHDLREVAGDLLGDGGLHCADHDFASCAIDGEHIVAAERPTLHMHLTLDGVDRKFARAHDAALAPTNRNNCGVTGLATG